LATPEYELVLMLDPEIPDERREQIASEARSRIESGGTLKHDVGWGMRKLAYEIRQRTEADYRFFRFETEGGLLDDLNHNLRIADGVLRFRIFKVDSRSPAIVPPPAMATSGGTPARGGRRPQAAPESEAPAAEAPESSQGEEADEAPEPASGEAAAPTEEAPAPSSETEEGEAQAEQPADEPPEPGSEPGPEPEAAR
jgi:small subunit ribosomal protein S6